MRCMECGGKLSIRDERAASGKLFIQWYCPTCYIWQYGDIAHYITDECLKTLKFFQDDGYELLKEGSDEHEV